MTGATDRSKGTSGAADCAPLAFEPWYRDEYPRVVRALFLIGRNRELAMDAASEAFARAFERWGRVSTMASPAGWTYIVALNVLRRYLRRSRLERILLRHSAEPYPQFQQGHAELWDALSALPLRERTAVVLHYLLDLPQSEVAEVMGVAPGTVAATLHSARRRLGATGLESEEEGHGHG